MFTIFFYKQLCQVQLISNMKIIGANKRLTEVKWYLICFWEQLIKLSFTYINGYKLIWYNKDIFHMTALPNNYLNRVILYFFPVFKNAMMIFIYLICWFYYLQYAKNMGLLYFVLSCKLKNGQITIASINNAYLRNKNK